MIKKEKSQKLAGLLQERAEAVEDVRQAEGELYVARWRFDYALGQDEIDYAIYSLEAAEKKLELLLRKAKRLWLQEEGRGDVG